MMHSERSTGPQPARIWVLLEEERAPQARGLRGLARILKSLGRSYGWRCLDYREEAGAVRGGERES